MLHHVRLASTASRVDALAFGGGAGPHGLGGPHAALAVASSHLSHNRWRGDLALYRAPALAEAAGDALQRAARPPLRLCGMQTCGGTTGVAWLRHGGPGAAALVAAGDSGDLTVWRVMRGADDMHDGLGDDGLGGNDPHSAAVLGDGDAAMADGGDGDASMGSGTDTGAGAAGYCEDSLHFELGVVLSDHDDVWRVASA